jgi:hypothetical protein
MEQNSLAHLPRFPQGHDASGNRKAVRFFAIALPRINTRMIPGEYIRGQHTLPPTQLDYSYSWLLKPLTLCYGAARRQQVAAWVEKLHGNLSSIEGIGIIFHFDNLADFLGLHEDTV